MGRNEKGTVPVPLAGARLLREIDRIINSGKNVEIRRKDGAYSIQEVSKRQVDITGI